MTASQVIILKVHGDEVQLQGVFLIRKTQYDQYCILFAAAKNLLHAMQE